MLRRFLLPGAVLLLTLLLVPACSGSRNTGKGTLPTDKPPPEPKAGGRPG
jgi:hypothetical protein